MGTLALIQTAVANQTAALASVAAFVAAQASDEALYTDLRNSGPAVVVDTTQTPPVVTLYSATTSNGLSFNVPFVTSDNPSGVLTVTVPGDGYTATAVRVAS